MGVGEVVVLAPSKVIIITPTQLYSWLMNKGRQPQSLLGNPSRVPNMANMFSNIHVSNT